MQQAKPMKLTDKLKQWWQTDCPFCLRMRWIIVWGIILLIVVNWIWF